MKMTRLLPASHRDMLAPMQTGCKALLIFGLLSLSAAATDYYKLPGTKRVDQDLYRSGKLLIVTRYCYHYTYGEDAILKYEGSNEFSGSKIIWADDDAPCDVKKVVSE
jgi:hypothetical protein